MIQIDYRDGKPIYEQIKEGMRRLITTGALQPDEKVPSVRDLATQLAINPNTIQRAYRELEQEGFIYKVTGRGTFASKVDPKESPRRQELLDLFDRTVSELFYLDTSGGELCRRIREAEEQVQINTSTMKQDRQQEGGTQG